MDHVLSISFAGLAGGLLGLLFFGGLWWTLRKAVASPRPALWVGVSLLVRMGGTAAGFVAIGAGDWRRLLSCLIGFWVARWLVLRLTAAPENAGRTLTLEGCDAPRP